jgi:hypothetical protein
VVFGNPFKAQASPHTHLAVHEHRQQPVAEGGEFLVLALAEDMQAEPPSVASVDPEQLAVE